MSSSYFNNFIKKIFQVRIEKNELWYPNFYSVIIPISLALLALFANNMRTNAYGPFYDGITNLNSMRSIIMPYLMIMISNFFSYFIGWLLIICYVYFGYLSRKNYYITELSNRNEKLAQNIIYNQYYSVQYFYTAIYNLSYGILNTLFFLIKMFRTYNDYTVCISSILVLGGFSTVAVLSLFLNKYFQTIYTTNYGKLMSFFDQLSSKSVIKSSINFNNVEFQQKKLMQSHLGMLLSPYFLEFINTTIAPLSYLIFFNSYYLKKYSYGGFAQINLMFSNIIFAIMFILNGCLDFGKFLAVYSELKEINLQNKCEIGESLILKGKALFYNKEELKNLPKDYNIIIGKKYNINISFEAKKKYYIFAQNGIGKTVFSQFFNFINEHQLVEKMMIPKSSIVIPERAKIFALNLQKDNYEVFIKNYNLFSPSIHISEDNLEKILEKFEYFNMATRWKIIAAYALLFDFILWDDPFWGVMDDHKSLDIFNKNVKSCVILGAYKFNNLNFESFNCIDLNNKELLYDLYL